MKSLETICRDFMNIAEDIKFYEIIKFWKKYDGYYGNIIFLINFNKERRLIREDDIKIEDRDKYKVFGFTPKPGLTNNPDHCILYCKALNSKNNWEYLKIKTNERTTKELWEKPRKTLTVLIYSVE